MAVMMGNLYAALRAANVDDEKAQKAAEEVAAYDNRMVSLEAKVDRLDAKFERLAWMVGVNITLTLMVLAACLACCGRCLLRRSNHPKIKSLVEVT